MKVELLILTVCVCTAFGSDECSSRGQTRSECQSNDDPSKRPCVFFEGKCVEARKASFPFELDNDGVPQKMIVFYRLYDVDEAGDVDNDFDNGSAMKPFVYCVASDTFYSLATREFGLNLNVKNVYKLNTSTIAVEFFNTSSKDVYNFCARIC